MAYAFTPLFYWFGVYSQEFYPGKSVNSFLPFTKNTRNSVIIIYYELMLTNPLVISVEDI